ncbi:hypothetical protein HJB52_29550 [Rhizobium lentis]|nr:hypothetical protein [Rhizobium bangladeshense]MBX5105950.1 hypothetical protein [Rhizobium lentis]MBY3599267.1 hypothetical protein [Rhizobium bangladeshense]
MTEHLVETTPDDLAGGAGRDAADEKCRGRANERAVPPVSHFMQRTDGQSTSWQLAIFVTDTSETKLTFPVKQN